MNAVVSKQSPQIVKKIRSGPGVKGEFARNGRHFWRKTERGKLHHVNTSTINLPSLGNAEIYAAADSSAGVVSSLRLRVEGSSLLSRTYRDRGDPVKYPEVSRLGAILSAPAAIFVFSAGDAAASQLTVLHNFQAQPAAYPASGLIAGPDGSLYGTTAIPGGCPKLCGAYLNSRRRPVDGAIVWSTNFAGRKARERCPSVDCFLTTPATCTAKHSRTAVHPVAPSIPTVARCSCSRPRRTVAGRRRCSTSSRAEPMKPFRKEDLLLDTAGNLYGTTLSGGSFNGNRCSTFGCGVAFELSPGSSSWALNAIYTFTGGNDGWQPDGLTFDVNGNLLGLAQFGGAFDSRTVFEQTAGVGGWTESVLYTFTGGSDGAYPTSQLIFDSKGNLYGTASTGGLVNCSGSGCGTPEPRSRSSIWCSVQT
jgi:hypothetical protein